MRGKKVKQLHKLARQHKPDMTPSQFRSLKALYNRLPWTKRQLVDKDARKLFV